MRFLRRWMHERSSAKMVRREGADYLERFYLFSFLGFKVFYHVFYMDDPDPLHDHPWQWGRIILRGRYEEIRATPGPDGKLYAFRRAQYGPGDIVSRRLAMDAHRVRIVEGPVHTIFWHWRRERVWGFYHPAGWHAAPEEAQDGRVMKGIILPRKIGQTPGEAKL